ncbi:unnamed protein product [Protopolystoma xenopodis]|uniref:Uncharacterized protein n=1 Tax=Protopolystoma xenopodis TaxID=117903 RepID=A0A448WMC6_9PLAT|nr:unnamed protein product [Protopolystoma xenopodis]
MCCRGQPLLPAPVQTPSRLANVSYLTVQRACPRWLVRQNEIRIAAQRHQLIRLHQEQRQIQQQQRQAKEEQSGRQRKKCKEKNQKVDNAAKINCTPCNISATHNGPLEEVSPWLERVVFQVWDFDAPSFSVPSSRGPCSSSSPLFPRHNPDALLPCRSSLDIPYSGIPRSDYMLDSLHSGVHTSLNQQLCQHPCRHDQSYMDVGRYDPSLSLSPQDGVEPGEATGAKMVELNSNCAGGEGERNRSRQSANSTVVADRKRASGYLF